MDKNFETNCVKVSGKVVEEPVFSHEFFGEKFYKFSLEVARKSLAVDFVPVIVSEFLFAGEILKTGNYISVHGQFRSYDKHTDCGNRLELNVFAKKIESADKGVCSNYIALDGYICKEPAARMTPLGREIADVLIAVNRSCGNSDYIPCIVWERKARHTAALPVGSHVKVLGRIQSREYVKKIDDVEETRVAYEVSVNNIMLCK